MEPSAAEGSGLELWRVHWPADPTERELENARRRLELGNLSGLWDALVYCSLGAVECRFVELPLHVWRAVGGGLSLPEWLARALVAVVDLRTSANVPEELTPRLLAAIGGPVPEPLLRALLPSVSRHLRSARAVGRGRHARWWVGWLQDLTDFERWSDLEDLRGRVRRAAVAELEILAAATATPSTSEALKWCRFKLAATRWSDQQVALSAAAALRCTSDPVSARSVLRSSARVRAAHNREPWRYALGLLGSRFLAAREERRRAEQPSLGEPGHWLKALRALDCGDEGASTSRP